MAKHGFGLSFVPGQPKDAGGGGPAGGAVSPVQQAIQMLSLRLPRVLGAQALAPGALMQGAGGAGVGGGGSLEALLALLFGQGAMAQPMGEMPVGPGGRPGTMRGEFPPMRPSAGPPAPRVGAGLVGPPIPGMRPGVPPLPNAGGWPPPPPLPTPAYTPAPGRPTGWGNAPDNIRPWGSAGPAGFAVPRSQPPEMSFHNQGGAPPYIGDLWSPDI